MTSMNPFTPDNTETLLNCRGFVERNGALFILIIDSQLICIYRERLVEVITAKTSYWILGCTYKLLPVLWMLTSEILMANKNISNYLGGIKADSDESTICTTNVGRNSLHPNNIFSTVQFIQDAAQCFTSLAGTHRMAYLSPLTYWEWLIYL